MPGSGSQTTIGVARPGEVRALIAKARAAAPGIPLRVHFHDTRGTGVANVVAAVNAGVTTVDAAIGGTGGCPFAPGAAGNVASEDVLYMLDGLGVRTGIDLAKLAEAGRFISDVLGRPPASKAAQALAARSAA